MQGLDKLTWLKVIEIIQALHAIEGCQGRMRLQGGSRDRHAIIISASFGGPHWLRAPSPARRAIRWVRGTAAMRFAALPLVWPLI